MTKVAEPTWESTNDQAYASEQSLPGSVEPRPSICLLGADYENSNLGIRALTTGALTAIDARYSDADVKIVDYGTNPKKYVFDLPRRTAYVELLNIRFSKKVWVKNHIARLIVTALFLALVPLRSFRRLLVRHNPWLKALIQADFVFALNYGDSFSDIYGALRFFYVSLPQVLAIALKRPVVQMPQTIGPFRSRVCRTVAKWILSRSALIYTRDEEALAEIRTLLPAGLADRVRFCPDLAFVVSPKSFASLDPQLEHVFSQRPLVGFNVSGLLWMGGYTQNNMFGLAGDYKALVREAISDLIEDRQAAVLLIAHVVSPVGEGDPKACDELFHELQGLYKDRIFVLRPPYSEREIKHVIGRCDFFVGARMHACIAALSQCVPATAMAYSSKFTGVFRSVGLCSTVADIRMLSTDQVRAAILSSFDSREAHRLVLRKSVPRAQRAVFDLLADCNVEIEQSGAHANVKA
jgi:colanic acid/amylovoran biosynthesis protein